MANCLTAETAEDRGGAESGDMTFLVWSRDGGMMHVNGISLGMHISDSSGAGRLPALGVSAVKGVALLHQNSL